MGKFDGVLICTDLDGTLLKDDKTVSRANLEAIEYFKSEGGFFTFITGRMPYAAAGICELIRPNVPFGCINGGGIYDHKKREYVWTRSLDREALQLVAYIDERVPEAGIQVNTFEHIYFAKESSAMVRFRKATGVPNLVRSYRDVTEPIGKVLFGDESEENIALIKKLLDEHPLSEKYDFIRSEKTLYEILPKGNSKGSVLIRLAGHVGVDIGRTVAVGDYSNDVSMLRAAGVGVAVANACPEAKLAADFITVSNNDDAIAKIISDIESGKLRV